MQQTDGLKERLREERLRLKLSQDYCAKLVGVSVSTWKNWEKGQTMPADIFQALIPAGFNVIHILFAEGKDGTVGYERIPDRAIGPEIREPHAEHGGTGTPSGKNSLTTDTHPYPPNRGQSAASPDLVILRNCIEVLEERDSYQRLAPADKARAIVALYELYLLEGKAPRDLLDRRQA